MIMSLRWLNDYVDVSDYLKKPEELAEMLTRAGLEVENITNKAKDFQSVVTGYILSKDKHPNADKLSLCQVTTQEGVVHQIVCGAQNHKAGDKVVVALPGAVLPGNFVIQKAAVRGIESGGMLCSEKELGLSKESSGILILPQEAPIGKGFAEYKGLDDVTFELKVTPNRADCLSHYGLAREVGCLLSRPVKWPAQALQASENSTRSQIDLEVRAKDLCPRYAGRFISAVKVGPSPDWLQKRLESVGLNSINNIVDVTNYVMLELGQPLHAFDVQLIEGKKIIVDRAKQGVVFETLDGTKLTLKGEELMIYDAQKPVAMAGVVGGKNSGVSEATTNIFLEAAYFQPMIVRKASRVHGINTDSGYRFSRGVDPDSTVKALDRAVELILKTAGGVAYGDHHDQYPSPIKKNPIQINIQTVSQRLGYAADETLFENYMKRLFCQVEKHKEKEFQILPPTFRFDLETEMDLVEEYARLHGYEHIPEKLPALHHEPTFQDPLFILNNRMNNSLRAQGYQQAMNLAFVSDQAETKFLQNVQHLKQSGLAVTEQKIRILNPLSDDLNVMRSTLCFGLFQNMVYNFHQLNDRGRLFELGKAFSHEGQFQESNRLSMIAWGHAEGLWNKNSGTAPLVFEAKAAIEGLLSDLKIHSYQWQPFPNKGQVPGFLHQGQAIQLLVEGKNVGFLGAAHPLLLDENKIRTQVVFAEFEIETFLRGQPRIERFKPVSKFPVVTRDLALVLPKTLKSSEVLKEMKKEGGPLLRSIDIFDLYEGESLEKGQVSIAFRLRFQDPNATLQDSGVQKIMDTILQSLKQKFNITVR